MNEQDLKNSILQLAVQGKLVEQREEEGTAEELLYQLEANKKQLIKEKKIRTENKLPKITEDEIPFDIPESWKWIRLGDIGSWKAGATPLRSHSEYYNGDIPWLKTGDLNDGLIKEVPEFISEKALINTSVRLNPVGSILMAMYGATIGKLGILDIEATTNQACCACITYEGIYNKYLFYYLLGQRRVFIKMGVGGAQPNISRTKIVESIIPIPPLEEQKRIVAKIEELMAYAEKYGEAYSKVEGLNKKFPEDMQKSILEYAIQGKLVEQREEEGNAEELYKEIQDEKKKLVKEGKIKKTKVLPKIKEDEIPFDIPESWKWVRLGDVTHNLGQKKPDTLFDYIDVGSIDNIKGCLSNKENLIESNDAPSRARKIVKEGSVLYSTVRPYLLNICIVDKKFRYEPIASTAFAVLHPLKGLNEKYLYFILRSQMFITYVNSVMIGVAYPAINDANLLVGLLPLPPLEEQERIVAKIEEILPYAKQLVK